MSGLPFDPMRKEPPPPPHIDTVSFNAAEYVMLRSRDEHEFVVHRECLRESPLLRHVFAKRQSIALEDLVVTFAAHGAAEEGDFAEYASPTTDGSDTSEHAEHGGGVDSDAAFVVAPAAASSSPTESQPAGKSGARSISLPFAAAAMDPAAAADESLPTAGLRPKSTAPPLVLTESLQLDGNVGIRFPTTSGATLDTIIAYLYYKHRYGRRPLEARDPFTVPSASAIAVMKIAKLLEC